MGGNSKSGGVGMTLIWSPEMGYLEIKSVLPGGPADLAGVRDSDLLIEIEGTNLRGKKFHDVKQALLGAPGTEVRIGILRNGIRIGAVLRRQEIPPDSEPPPPFVHFVHSQLDHDDDARSKNSTQREEPEDCRRILKLISLETDLAAAKSQNAELHSLLSAAKKRTDELQQAVAERDDLLKIANLRIKELEAELGGVPTKATFSPFPAKDAKIRSLADELKAAQSQLDCKTRAMESLHASYVSLEQELAVLRESGDSSLARTNMGILQATLREKEKTIAFLSENLTKYLRQQHISKTMDLGAAALPTSGGKTEADAGNSVYPASWPATTNWNKSRDGQCSMPGEALPVLNGKEGAV